jgi:uncharacterized protein (DUF1810 family)
MTKENDLKRFLDAQETAYPAALAEVKAGRKRSHWMWYVFPQIAGLGFSSTSRYYAIKDMEEAEAYLNDPVLGARLINICHELLKLEGSDAGKVFGSPDDLKLLSSMTLFTSLKNTHPVFAQVLEKFFHGIKDAKTLQIISGHS